MVVAHLVIPSSLFWSLKKEKRIKPRCFNYLLEIILFALSLLGMMG